MKAEGTERQLTAQWEVHSGKGALPTFPDLYGGLLSLEVYNRWLREAQRQRQGLKSPLDSVTCTTST